MKILNYLPCLVLILFSCNKELPIENAQAPQTSKNQEESTILSFKNTEDFLATIDNFNPEKPTRKRANSSFVSAERLYSKDYGNNDIERIGFLIPDEKYRNFFNKDLEIIVNDTLYKVTKYGTLFTHISNKQELQNSLSRISKFKMVSQNTKQFGNIKLIDTFGLWNNKSANPITDDDFFENDKDDVIIGNEEKILKTRSSDI